MPVRLTDPREYADGNGDNNSLLVIDIKMSNRNCILGQSCEGIDKFNNNKHTKDYQKTSVISFEHQISL